MPADPAEPQFSRAAWRSARLNLLARESCDFRTHFLSQTSSLLLPLPHSRLQWNRPPPIEIANCRFPDFGLNKLHSSIRNFSISYSALHNHCATGIVNVNVEPLPYSLSTVISPPRRSASFLDK